MKRVNTSPEGLRVEQTKYPAEGVVAWDAVLECEDAAQQSLLSGTEFGHCGATRRSRQRRQQSNEQYLRQIMQRVDVAWIRQFQKDRAKLLHWAPHHHRKTLQNRNGRDPQVSLYLHAIPLASPAVHAATGARS
jgi:hypothetical protein